MQKSNKLLIFIILLIGVGFLYLELISTSVEGELNNFEIFTVFLIVYMFIYSINYIYFNLKITLSGKRAGQQQDLMESFEEEKFRDDKSFSNPDLYSGRIKYIINSSIFGLGLFLILFIFEPNLRSIFISGITVLNAVVFVIYFACLGNFIFKNKTNLMKYTKFKSKVKLCEINLPPYPTNENEFSFVIGEQHGQKGDRNENPKWFSVKDKGLYAGFLVVGDTGSGKTTSIGYPFLSETIKRGLGGLVLDAGMQYISFVKKQMALAGRSDDLIIIQKKGDLKYNPIAKKNVASSDLANGIFQVIKNLSPAQSSSSIDAYWDQAGKSFCMAMIELLRLFNSVNEHVTLDLLYRWNINEMERNNVLTALNAELNKGTTPERAHRIEFVLNFFNNYWRSLSPGHSSSISAQFNAVVSMFSSDFDLNKTFCPGPGEINLFKGFDSETLENKIVILNMPAKDISGRVIGIFLKLDFQRSVLRRTECKSESDIKKPVFFLCDEAQNFVSASNDSGDAMYLAESRKNLPINLYMSQSIDSYLNAFKDEREFNVFLNNLRTKIIFSQEGVESQKICSDLCGKETTYKRSYVSTESGRDTDYSYSAGEFIHAQSAQSRATSKNEEIDYIFQPHDFRALPVFVSIVSPFTGDRKLQPRIIYTKPIFVSTNGDIEYIERETWFKNERANYKSYLEYVKDEEGKKQVVK